MTVIGARAHRVQGGGQIIIFGAGDILVNHYLDVGIELLEWLPGVLVSAP